MGRFALVPGPLLRKFGCGLWSWSALQPFADGQRSWEQLLPSFHRWDQAIRAGVVRFGLDRNVVFDERELPAQLGSLLLNHMLGQMGSVLLLTCALCDMTIVQVGARRPNFLWLSWVAFWLLIWWFCLLLPLAHLLGDVQQLRNSSQFGSVCKCLWILRFWIKSHCPLLSFAAHKTCKWYF